MNITYFRAAAVFAAILSASTSVANAKTALPSKATKPPEIADDKFDLVCESKNMLTGETGSPAHFHIDLQKNQWCDDYHKCDQPQALIVTPDEFWFDREKIDSTPVGMFVMNYWIDRKTGMLHFTRLAGGTQVYSKSEGMCQKQPYGTPTKNVF